MSQLFTSPFIPAFGATGLLSPSADLFFYLTGTTTDADVYTSAARTTAHPQPVPANAYGQFPAIYLDPTVTYRAVLKTAAGATIADFDPVSSPVASDGIAFIQAGTGAVSRTMQAKGREIVSVEDFGAVGDGVANDTTAIQAALDTGAALMFPAGTYNLTGKLTSTNKPVQIYTQPGVTLKWLSTATTQGLDFAFNNITSQFCQIGDIALVTEKEGGGTAIKCVWPTSATGYARLFEAGNIRISGADIPGLVGYWDVGIDLTNAWLAFCNALDFYGKPNGVIPLSTAAFAARGTTTDARVNIRARWALSGLLIAGFSELMDISGSIFVACDYAVNCSGTGGLNTPGFIWLGGHASCFRGAVRSVNLLQGNVNGLLIYKRPDSAQNFVAFDLDSASTEWQITDCKVFSLANPGGGTTTAIKDAGTNNSSAGIRTVGCNTDVEIVANASGFNHAINRSDNARGVITQGDADGVVAVYPGGAYGSSTSYFDTLAADSATPSILGYRRWGAGGGHFLTANTVATTVTNFTGAFPGDEIVVQAGDANTTIENNAGLVLNGAVNKVMANGDTIRLRRVNSTQWKQIG